MVWLPTGKACRPRYGHPFHPAAGQEFEAVTWRHNWGEDRIYFRDRAGKLRSVPAQRTSLIGEGCVLREYCGDGVLQDPWEICDDGASEDFNGCSAWCQVQ